MKIKIEINSQIKVPQIIRALFRRAARLVEAKLNLKKDLSVSVGIIGSAGMKKLNFRYRRKNKPTDVLSFEEINEIIICLPQAVKQSKIAKHSLENELTFLFIHGLLHLLGYEDETAKGFKLMLALGTEITQKVIKK